MQKTLSIILSERDDPVGTMITMRAVLEDLKSCDFSGEVVIVDNSESKFKSKVIKDLTEAYISTGDAQLLYQPFRCLFSARDLGVKKALGKYIMVLDSHCLLYKGTLKAMVEFAESTPNLGVLFGVMCYSCRHAEDAFCDRDVRTFIPIRVAAYKDAPPAFKIPLRSMPYMITKDLYTFMRGYSPLSTNRLAWGGGDFLISFKPLLLGYDNWVLTNYGAVHLGPFNDKGWFAPTYLFNGSPYGRHLGMLVAAYVVGGQGLLLTRSKQISNRRDIRYPIERIVSMASEYGSAERVWIEANAKTSYNQICNKFKSIQGDVSAEKYPIENILPEAKKFRCANIYPYNPLLLGKVRSKIKQTTGVKKWGRQKSS